MSQIANGHGPPGNGPGSLGNRPEAQSNGPGVSADTTGSPGTGPGTTGHRVGEHGLGTAGHRAGKLGHRAGTPGVATAGEARPPAIAENLEALSAHYKHAYGRLYRDALGIVSSPETAAEVVQDAYADTTAKIIAGYEVRHLGAWFKVVVRNLALQRREERLTVPLSEEIGSSRSDAPADIAYARQRCRELYRTVEQLGAAQRSAFVLAELHGLSYREIAETMDRTENSIRSLLARARKQVREALGTDTSFLTAPLVRLEAVHGLAAGRALGFRDHVAAKLADVYASVTALLQRSVTAISQPTEALIAGALVVVALNAGPADRPPPAGGDTGAPLAAVTAPSPDPIAQPGRSVSPAREPANGAIPPAGADLPPSAGDPGKTAGDKPQPGSSGHKKPGTGGKEPQAGTSPGVPAEGAEAGQGPADGGYTSESPPAPMPSGTAPGFGDQVGELPGEGDARDPPVEDFSSLGQVGTLGEDTDRAPLSVPVEVAPSRGEVVTPAEGSDPAPPLAGAAGSAGEDIDPSPPLAESSGSLELIGDEPHGDI